MQRTLNKAALVFNDYDFSKKWIDKSKSIWFKYWPMLINEDGF